MMNHGHEQNNNASSLFSTTSMNTPTSIRPASISDDALIEDIKNFSIRGQVEEAERVFVQLAGKGKADIKVFNHMLGALCVSNKLERAKEMLKEMTSRYRVEPN